MMLNMLFNTFLKIKPGNRKEEEAEKRKNKVGILMKIFVVVTHPAFYPTLSGASKKTSLARVMGIYVFLVVLN